jgi:hypothetical protein
MAMHRSAVPSRVRGTQPQPKWEDVIKHLEWRHWPEIRRKWASVQGLPAGVNTTIQHGIRELPSVVSVCEGQEQSIPWHIAQDVPGLREGLFIESYILLLKAINVAGGSQIHIDGGACGWSLSSGYHAAFFAAKAICGLLGVSLIELDRSIAVDVWAPPEQLSSKQRKAGVAAVDRFLFVKWIKSRVDHEPVWKMFQRLLRVTVIDAGLWPAPLVKFLTNCPSDAFAAHRNRLHYQNHYWPFPKELTGFDPQADFGRPRRSMSFEEQLNGLEATEDYPIVLGFALCWMGTVLFADLAQLIVGLALNANILNSALEQACNERYRSYRDVSFCTLLSAVAR